MTAKKEPSSKSSRPFAERLLRRLTPDRFHRSPYQKYLIYQHRNFDVKGLTTQGLFTLELEQVFVDLSLKPEERQPVSSDPIRPMPRLLRNGRYDLWAYLTSKSMRGRNLIILGPPGSGKTTLLKYLALALAVPNAHEQAKRVGKLPILLFLRDHATAIEKNPNLSILQALQERLEKWNAQIPDEAVEVPLDWFAGKLEKGKCLIMLDGLDEVADPELRRRVVNWVARQMGVYAKNQFLVTSRPFGYYSNPLEDVTVLEVRPFTFEQVNQFVHNWYLANEIMSAQQDDAGVRKVAQDGAQDLLIRLRRTPVLLEMSVNPLLLTMIATVHRYRSSLPGRRVELYAEIAEVFLGKRHQARGITYELTPAQKQRVLEDLAHHMMRQRKREIPVEEVLDAISHSLHRVIGDQGQREAGINFLKMIENTSGLLVEREAGVYGFAHLTFQEYLAAVHVRDQRLEAELVQHVEDSWWHETIRLYAAQADATNIVKACLSRKRPSVVALTLAMECLEEAREVRPELRNIFEKLAGSVDHERPDVRRVAAEVLLSLRLRRFIRLDESRFIDSSPVTHAEYQIFLDEERVHGRYHVPDHWAEEQFPSGRGQEPVMGVRAQDAAAFCDWLTRRENGEWRYRLPHVRELKQIVLQDEEKSGTVVPAAFWFVADGHYRTSEVWRLEQWLVDSVTRQMEARISFDWGLDSELEETGVKFSRVRDLILRQLKRRQYKMLDLSRALPAEQIPHPELAQNLEQARDRDSLVRANDLARILKDAVTDAQDLNLTQARTVSLDEIAELVEGLVTDLNDFWNLENARELGRAIDHNFAYARELARNSDLVMNQELIRAINNAWHNTRDLANLLAKRITIARARARAQTLLMAVAYLEELIQEPGNGRSQTRAYNKQQLLFYIDWYLDFALLEERMAEKIPALEGIFIVRERKPVS